ncbi:TetR/AcrR family transcriptional regulator [Paenibacillus caui]|uniref:TetR/AcrR family transcriptional regulator n=1 Tax=Paenibacillus caui TaxID=2873927 RepID=UPI001CA8908E|nr:TetR/AcrR family transcriptional regulator [Paenibacillus caui]
MERKRGKIMTAPTDTDMKMRILLAAKRLFAKQGFEGTSVRQICDEAGANVALVSYYFGGKENVFYALFDTFYPVNRIELESSRFLEPVSGVEFLITEVIRFRMENPEMINVLQQEIFKKSHLLPRILNYVLPVWKKLRSLLEEGRTQGLFQFRSLDNTLFFVMGAVLFHQKSEYFQGILDDPSPSREQFIEDTLKFVFNGLGMTSYPEGKDG